MASDHSTDGFHTTSNITIDKVVITTINQTTARTMTGNAVGNYYPDGSAYQTTVPQLVATAYLKGVALNPQPRFLWESSNPCCCSVDQNGNCTRVTSIQNLTFNSAGAANLTVSAATSNVGGLAQITATALRQDGSQSGVRGTVNIAVQDSASRQWSTGSNAQPSCNGVPTPNYFSLVGDQQPPSDES